MARKIKYHSLSLLFRLFAYLADKSGGWWVFVKPKLMLGSVILGLGFTVSGMTMDRVQKPRKKLPNNQVVKCYTCAVIVKDKPDSNRNDQDEMVLCYVSEQMPVFPGGEQELINYLSKHLRYPNMLKDKKIHGKVIVRFLVTKTGRIENVQILRSLDPNCDKEAIRVVKSLPKWIPGKQNGVNVDVWYTLPLTFKSN